MTAALGPCSELFKHPHSNLYKNAKLRLNEDDRDFIKNLGGIYFIKSGDYIKIGKSRDFSARLKQLQTAHFNLLELIHSIPIFSDSKMSLVEKILHNYFKDNLTESQNEWFHFTGELKKFVELKPTLHDLIDLISGSSNANFRRQVNKLRKDFSNGARIPKDVLYLSSIGHCPKTIRKRASLAAQEMEELQLMLLNYNISKPQRYIYNKRCEDWLEYAKVFINDWDLPICFAAFRHENDRLSRIPFYIERFQKFEINGIII